MKNRLKSYNIFQISEDFLSYPFVARLELFKGPDIRQLISKYVEYRIQEAKEEAFKEGYKEAIEKIKETINKEIEDYMALVTKIVDLVYETAKKEFKDLKIIEERTNFYFSSKWIKILFIIETESSESEIDFSNFLNEVEKVVFDKLKYACELFFLNKKNVEIDQDSLNNDYPFIRKRENSL
ncbi:MAG: hypothetical protein DRP81_06225 [Candidatus Omnitrophota bacterium]|nr:MAG: hypothetical protein DRP81_06225 [Candidatus Omnitrophota bacterium]